MVGFIDILTHRSSYRGRYDSIPVPREDLRKILEAGLAAPSGCNKQTTSLIAIDDIDILRQLHAKIHPPIGTTAPAMICVLTKRIVAYRDRCYSIQDYSAAIMSMLIACEALGYSTCWIEGHITDEDQIGRQMADILGVPSEYELVCFLPIGIASEPSSFAKKMPFEKRAWFNGYEQSEAPLGK